MVPHPNVLPGGVIAVPNEQLHSRYRNVIIKWHIDEILTYNSVLVSAHRYIHASGRGETARLASTSLMLGALLVNVSRVTC